MSRKDLQTEENFWPCVSDMFLALFVIALVLYSSMSADKGKGDEYISALAAKEACSLVQTLKKNYPDSVAIQQIDLDAISKEKGTDRSELAVVLYGILDNAELNAAKIIKKEHLPQEYLPKEEQELSYIKAIHALYMATSEDGKMEADKENPCHNDYMREVRERIERAILLSGTSVEGMSDEELVAEIKKLRNMLLNTVERSRFDELQRRYDELSKICGDNEELIRQLEKLNAELKAAKKRIEELEKQISGYHQIIREKDDEIAKWKDVVAKMIDLRIDVMNQVVALLNTPKYQELKDYGVEVHAREGLIIVPSSAFSFPKATTRYYQQGKGIVTADLEKRLENEVRRENPQYLENLKLLSAFLDEIGQMVAQKALPVDNIAIECHTDNDVSKITDKRFYNDGLSLQRAFDAWRLLDKYADGRLSQYRNADKQGLFSMTGFGMRVPPKRKENESKAEYEERCRRMQIRFNCSPQRVDTQSGEYTLTDEFERNLY